jgi:8-oxo-dGTP diphosphatase
MPSETKRTVVAGVIERQGKILICQRMPGGRHSLKWEFPGGKVEPGEDPTTALKRELREELAIDADIGRELARYETRYGDGPEFDLRFYDIAAFSGEPRNMEFAQIAWVEAARLPEYDFLEGDVAFVKELSSSRSLP